MFKIDKDGFLINEKGEFVDIKGNKVEKGIKLSDIKFFTEEDLNKARTDEKGKLYDQINKSQETINSLSGKIKEISDQLTSATTLISDLKKEKEGNADEGKDNAKDDKKQAVIEKQITVLTDALKSFESKLAEESTKREFFETQLSLERYKNLKIKEAGGESNLILELVSGNTLPEIDASIELSKKKFAEIKDTIIKNSQVDAERLKKEEEEKKKKEEEEKRNRPVVTLKQGGQQDSGKSEDVEVELTPEKISSLTRKDFSANREAVLASIKMQLKK